MNEIQVLRIHGDRRYTDVVGPIQALAIPGMVLTILCHRYYLHYGGVAAETAVLDAFETLAARYPERELIACDWYPWPDTSPAVWAYCVEKAIRPATSPECIHRVQAEYGQRNRGSENRSL